MNDLHPRGKEKAIKRIMKIMAKHNSTLNVIDMHNVLDLFENDSVTPFQSLEGIRICISWVGNPDGEIGKALVPDMYSRIKSGQILFGIICSKRGKRNKIKPNKSICVEPGSKAYIINKLAEWSKCNEIHFFDDAPDHIDSVDSLERDVKTYLVPKGSNGINFLVKQCKNIRENTKSQELSK
jgi:hypothetical protein